MNRTSQTINGVTTSYCYDYADRLKSSTDPLANGALYDSHGNMTQIGTGTTPLYLSYDSSDRNWAMEQYTSAGNGTAVYYSRDAQGRVTFRDTDAIAARNWTTTDEQWYGYTGNGDGASFVRDTNWDITEKYLSLPGGISLTIRPQATGSAQKTYSLPNLHGSIMATTNAIGVTTGTFAYDPFGNKTSSTLPDNASTGSTLG
jgi:YD repeat-containing protein